MERSSAGQAPFCSGPETIATAQRHHLYVSVGCTHTHTQRSVERRVWRLKGNELGSIIHADT